jgi:hypothetical protein
MWQNRRLPMFRRKNYKDKPKAERKSKQAERKLSNYSSVQNMESFFSKNRVSHLKAALTTE